MVEVLGIVFAVTVPLVLWPLSAMRVMARLEAPVPRLLGFIAGVLGFGWALGLLILLLPRQDVWLYTAVLLTVAALGIAWGRRPPPLKLVVPEWTSGLALLVLAPFGMILLANALLFPSSEHDLLNVELFVRNLMVGWDYWALPRYVPDARGFYYPLSHTPPMMSLLAWIRSFTTVEWVARLPSAALFAATGAALYAAGEGLRRGAGAWVLAAAVSSTLFVKFFVLNGQDVYRYAAFAGALLVFARTRQGNLRDAAVAGGFLGLAASYHSLQVVMLALLPGAFWLSHRLQLRAFRGAAAMVAAGVVVAAYPYVAAMLEIGRPLIPTRSIHAIPNVSRFLRETMSTYAKIDPNWSKWGWERLQVVLPEDSGIAGMGFAVCLLIGIMFVKLRPEGPERRNWAALAMAAVMFLVVVLDPGNILFGKTGYGFWSNRRYPLTVMPLFSLITGVGVAALLARLPWYGRLGLGAPVLWLALSVPSTQYALGAKVQPERGEECLFCSEEAKLAGNRGSATYRAVRWLERQGRACLTFRETDYFYYSASLTGATYYDPRSERALAAETSEKSARVLLDAGLSCVFIESRGAIRRSLEEHNAAFIGIGRLPNVWVLDFYDMEVWLLGENEVVYGELRHLEPPAEPTQVFEVDVPGYSYGELLIDYDVERPANVVAWYEFEGVRRRTFLRTELSGGRLVVPFAGQGPARIRFWFGSTVKVGFLGLREVTL